MIGIGSILASLLALQQPCCSDGYQLPYSSIQSISKPIEYVFYKNEDELQKAYPKHNPNMSSKVISRVRAFSVLLPDKCSIHIVDPRIKWQPEVLGHELSHCMFGQWH